MNHSKMLTTRRRNKKNLKLRTRIAKRAKKLEQQSAKPASNAAQSAAS